MKLIIFFIIFTSFVGAKNVDIITNWPLSDMEIEIPENNIQVFNSSDNNYQFSYDSDKVIVMNPCVDIGLLHAIPKEKLVLFTWEPDGASSYYCEAFDRVYTFNDDLVDGKKYFKYHYPSLHPMISDLVSFEQRKLCTMIVANWRPERVKLVRFFERKALDDFEFYGQRSFQPGHRLYRGKIPGCVHFGSEKISTLQKYRFAICFENSQINGYITEKIFGCFTAGCIPIYLGAPNIEDYIPKNCFIDYRNFKSDDEMYQFIKHMSKEQYLQYLDNIRSFLNSEKAQVFSLNIFYKVISDI